jgi:hypothetical protein
MATGREQISMINNYLPELEQWLDNSQPYQWAQ